MTKYSCNNWNENTSHTICLNLRCRTDYLMETKVNKCLNKRWNNLIRWRWHNVFKDNYPFRGRKCHPPIHPKLQFRTWCQEKLNGCIYINFVSTKNISHNNAYKQYKHTNIKTHTCLKWLIFKFTWRRQNWESRSRYFKFLWKLTQ